MLILLILDSEIGLGLHKQLAEVQVYFFSVTARSYPSMATAHMSIFVIAFCRGCYLPSLVAGSTREKYMYM